MDQGGGLHINRAASGGQLNGRSLEPGPAATVGVCLLPQYNHPEYGIYASGPQLFVAPRIFKPETELLLLMKNLYTSLPDSFNEEHKRNFNRLLRRLRLALLIWLISFIATVVWFTYAR